MTKYKKRISYTGQRLLALIKGKENIDDFPETETFTIYCVSRDLTIHCTQNDLGWYFENTNYELRGR